MGADFLALDEALAIHAHHMSRYGGVLGIRASDDALVGLVLGVASGARSKADVAVFLRQHTVA